MSDVFSDGPIAPKQGTSSAQAAQNGEAPERSKLPWGPVGAPLYGLFVAFLGAQILASVVLGVVLALGGLSENAISDWLSSNVGLFVFSLVSAAATLGLIALYVTKKTKSGRWLGLLGLNRPKWIYIIWAVLGYIIYMMIYLLTIIIAKAAVPALDLEQEQQLGFSDPKSTMDLAILFVSLVVLPPVVEEVLFRGFIFRGIRSRSPFWVAAIVTSILFAVGHLQFGLDAPLLWVAAIDTFVLSMVMTFVVEKTGSIWPTILIHAIKNGVAFSVLYIVGR